MSYQSPRVNKIGGRSRTNREAIIAMLRVGESMCGFLFWLTPICRLILLFHQQLTHVQDLIFAWLSEFLESKNNFTLK